MHVKMCLLQKCVYLDELSQKVLWICATYFKKHILYNLRHYIIPGIIYTMIVKM